MQDSERNGVVETILSTLAAAGGEMYAGEPVTQLEHALQCAHFAKAAGANDKLVAAALLHDYGHLLNEDDASAAARGVDLEHEEIAANHLERWFPPDVTEPIRMHVPAKRYLCAVDPAYMNELSPASIQSLEVQGGAFTQAEVAEFDARPFSRDAVSLRRWDDKGKVAGLEVAGVEAYRDVLKASIEVE